MSSGHSDRTDRVAALKAELARGGGLSVLFSQAIADRAGINPTDLESLDILRRQGPMSAGRLAELTGLTTGGAITALIDRLERRGYARRERDQGDRRRVLVRATAEQAERELGAPYAALDLVVSDLLASYSDVQIDLLLDFLTRSNALMQAQIARVRADARPFPGDEAGSASDES